VIAELVGVLPEPLEHVVVEDRRDLRRAQHVANAIEPGR
jgi:hypothetical protein